jgi:P pilus assembly chaperone PapD
MRYLRDVAVAMTLAVTLGIVPVTALALGGISVWPTRVELTVNRGEQANKIIHIHNQGSEPITIKAYASDFAIDREGSFIFLEPGDESYSAARWLSIGEQEFELAAGETKEVEVVVSAPDEVEPGGHYAAIFFEAMPPQREGAVWISTRIPTLFYITIPGVTGADVIASADIISLQLPGVTGRGPVAMGAVVRNSGNVHLTVAGKAYFGASTGGSSELDLGQAVILPDSDALLKGEWQESPFFGRVKANVVIGYLDHNGELVNKSQTAEFWVVPWSVVGIIVFVIGIAIPAIVVISRRYRLRLERK